MKTPLNFSYSNREGVGFLMIYGGVPQFSISWDGNFEPQRMTLAEAENVHLIVDGYPVNSYEFHESWNKCEMKLKGQDEPVVNSEEKTEDESGSDENTES